jgi:hypothetical protein
MEETRWEGQNFPEFVVPREEVMALKNRTHCWKFYEIDICLDEGLGSILWAISDYVCYSLNM